MQLWVISVISAIRPCEMPRINTSWLGYGFFAGFAVLRLCMGWNGETARVALCARGGERGLSNGVWWTARVRRIPQQEERPACRRATRSPETESRWRPWGASHESVEVIFSKLSDTRASTSFIPPPPRDRDFPILPSSPGQVEIILTTAPARSGALITYC